MNIRIQESMKNKENSRFGHVYVYFFMLFLQFVLAPKAAILLKSLCLLISKTICQMVIDQARRLHEGVHDGWADELEAAPLQVFAESVGF